MFNRLLCSVAFVMLPLALPAQPPDKATGGERKPTKNETVMSPGMRIQATTPVGAIVVTAVDELTRSYTWEGATRSVEMWPRPKRWYGSLGLYYPGPGEHWKEHKGITRGVTEEGQQHFKSADAAVAWIRERKWTPYVYRDDGLLVGWSKTLPRRQLNVEVWQILVDGRQPARLPGSENDKIVVTRVELWTSPLGKAVQKNNARAVKALLAEGADPNAMNIERPVLVEAAKLGYHDIVRTLLDKGARPNARSEDGSTALLGAAAAGHVETVKALLAGGADVNAPRERGLDKGTTPLIAAAFEGKAEVVKVLLEKGADVNANSEVAGLTALYFAREGKHQEVVRLLKEAGAKDYGNLIDPGVPVQEASWWAWIREYGPWGLGATLTVSVAWLLVRRKTSRRRTNGRTRSDAMPVGSEQSVFCGGCGTALDQPANLPVGDRTPCPLCGSMSRHINVMCADSPKVADSLSMKLTPGAQARDWRQRWVEIQAHLKRLLAPHSEPLSGESIQTANHELQSFFVQAYHLKDSLIQDSGTTGIPASTIENAITLDTHLALLADLANLDKHGKLTKPPRSGDVPAWGVSGVANGDAGWRLSVEIHHKAKTLDGLTFAGEAVSAWDKQLRHWGLI
jgi:hypothetical protein